MNRLLTDEEFTQVVNKGLRQTFPGKWVIWKAVGVHPDGRPLTISVLDGDEPRITLRVTDNSNGE